MQFHLDTFRPGDPDLFPSVEPASDEIDVLIVGAGPAGLTLAAYLSRFPTIRTVLLERKDGPMEKGQADGVSCRSMEMFQTFGFAERVKREAYWVNEATFWKPDPEDPARITRNGRVQDVEEGLSEMPHVILNQARVHDMYLEVMRKSPTRLEPLYGRAVTGLRTDPDGVTVDVEHGGKKESLRARYVVGCDGARSAVRRAIGRKLEGDSANQAWGVMDILCNTDFPDIRYKSLIQSAEQGTVLIIPREGGYLVRLYVEMDKLNPEERVANRDLQASDLIAAANRILAPYTIDVKEVAWWSVYEIGHRLTDRFDDAEGDPIPQVFIAGDACHTHSPKAGQGMNVSMGDAFNLGWKLVQVLAGASDASLLRSYSEERQSVAQDLIDFDHEWARIMSAPPETREGEDAPRFQKYFVEHGRYTAGVSVRYTPSLLTGDGRWQHLAKGFPIGMRFHSAPVIRLADGKSVHLGHVQRADARWSLLAFPGGGTPEVQIERLRALCARLDPVLEAVTPKGGDPDCRVDLRAVLDAHHHALDITAVPERLFPAKGALGLRDYEKVFCSDHPQGNVYDMRGINRDPGCLILVRPDQYVANVLPWGEAAALAEQLGGIFKPT
ncbi:FAD-dependent monooxygenase [Marimonas sp. MJW-29]|uniref:FAD-dependent monooxygenase n=1 Tax=Sulfitobacter sediminis TaxID=3234186 RepID=A0ABV3RR43_9RHOB